MPLLTFKGKQYEVDLFSTASGLTGSVGRITGPTGHVYFLMPAMVDGRPNGYLYVTRDWGQKYPETPFRTSAFVPDGNGSVILKSRFRRCRRVRQSAATS